MQLGLGLGINRAQVASYIPVIGGQPAWAGFRVVNGQLASWGGVDFNTAFSRSTVATFIDASGNIQTAALNVPRVQGGRLLMEAGRTRLNPYVSVRSEFMTPAGTTDTNLNENVLGQFGGMRVASGGDAGHVTRSALAQVTSGVTYAVKFLYRAGTSGRVRLRIDNGGVSSVVLGAVGALSVTSTTAGAVSILRDTPLANGLRETVLLWTSISTSGARGCFGPDSATAGQTVDAFAWQAEAGTVDTSWILGDNNASVTRAADLFNWSIPAALQARMANGFWAGVKGGRITPNGSFDRLFQFDDGNIGNRLELLRDTAAGRFGFNMFAAGVSQAGTSIVSAVTTVQNAAVRFSPNNYASIMADGSQSTDLSATYVNPTFLRLAANDGASGGKPAILEISEFPIFDPAITLAQAEAWRAS